MIHSLPSNVTGQDAGLKSIVKAFSEWESNKKDGPTGPLVLAIVGPNGVGKSETGNIWIDCNILCLMTLNINCAWNSVCVRHLINYQYIPLQMKKVF